MDSLVADVQSPLVTPGWYLPVPLLARLPIAAAIVAWGGLTGRRWTVPVGATIALPVLWFNGLAVLDALVPLVLIERIRPVDVRIRAATGARLARTGGMSLDRLWAFLAVALPMLGALIANLSSVDLAYQLRAGDEDPRERGDPGRRRLDVHRAGRPVGRPAVGRPGGPRERDGDRQLDRAGAPALGPRRRTSAASTSSAGAAVSGRGSRRC